MAEVKSIIVKDYLHIFEEGRTDTDEIFPGSGVEMFEYNGSIIFDVGSYALGVAVKSMEKSTLENFEQNERIKVWIPQRGDIGYVRVSASANIGQLVQCVDGNFTPIGTNTITAPNLVGRVITTPVSVNGLRYAQVRFM